MALTDRRAVWLWALLTAALLLGTAAAARCDSWERGMIAVSLADLASTEYALHSCGTACREANPLLRDGGGRLAIKAGSIVLADLAYRRIRRHHPRAARIFAGVTVAALSAVVVNNLSVSRGVR